MLVQTLNVRSAFSCSEYSLGSIGQAGSFKMLIIASAVSLRQSTFLMLLLGAAVFDHPTRLFSSWYNHV